MADLSPDTPRLAATVLLIRDDPFEVLMIRRRKGESYGSALVFPGGVVDPEDRDPAWLDRLESGADLPSEERALRIAALREVYEEAGLLAATAHPPASCQTGTPFSEALGGTGLDLAQVVPFGHWITPPATRQRRFDTHFFLCPAPRDAEAICDGDEAVALEWASPEALLERAAAGENSILFPTRMNLGRLRESQSVAEALGKARERPIVTVMSRVERLEDGVMLHLPPDAGYHETGHFMPYPKKD